MIFMCIVIFLILFGSITLERAAEIRKTDPCYARTWTRECFDYLVNECLDFEWGTKLECIEYVRGWDD